MSAIVIATQRNRGCVHVACDAAVYTRDQVVHAFTAKVLTVPHWPGAVVNTGNAGATPLLGMELANRFASFDALIEGAAAILPQFVREYAIPTGADVILAGISESRGPAAFMFRTDETIPLTTSAEQAAASPYCPPPCQLVELPDVVMTPVPDDQVMVANYEGVDLNGEPDALLWSIKKILEMQRHMALPEGMGGIGGFGQVTSIYASGDIRQRVLQRWPDQLGRQPVRGLFDWKRWHVENPKPPGERTALRLVQ